MKMYEQVRPDDEAQGEFGDHTLTVEYLYERQSGQWNLVGIDYLCFDCMNQSGVEHPALHAMPDQQLHDARLYLLGEMLTIECE